MRFFTEGDVDPHEVGIEGMGRKSDLIFLLKPTQQFGECFLVSFCNPLKCLAYLGPDLPQFRFLVSCKLSKHPMKPPPKALSDVPSGNEALDELLIRLRLAEKTT